MVERGKESGKHILGGNGTEENPYIPLNFSAPGEVIARAALRSWRRALNKDEDIYFKFKSGSFFIQLSDRYPIGTVPIFCARIVGKIPIDKYDLLELVEFSSIATSQFTNYALKNKR